MSDYVFKSGFVAGKTYAELTEDELKKLTSGFGIKKEDAEYLKSMGIEKGDFDKKEEEVKDEPKAKANANKFVTIPIDPLNEKDLELSVTINGETTVITRGVNTAVTDEVYEVLVNAKRI